MGVLWASFGGIGCWTLVETLWGSSRTACVHGYSSAIFFEYRHKPGIIPTYLHITMHVYICIRIRLEYCWSSDSLLIGILFMSRIVNFFNFIYSLLDSI